MRERTERFFNWLRSLDGISCLLLLAIALGVRLYFAPNLMVTGDMVSYESWGESINANFWHVYSANATNVLNTTSWFRIPVYPPVALYLYGLVTKVYFGLGALFGIALSHDVMTSHGLKLALKLPGIVADEVFITVIYLKAIKVLSRKVAWMAALTYALSPGILITVVWWGQTDGIVAALVLLGLLSGVHKKPVWTGIFFALAVNFKPTPAIFIPLVLVYLLRTSGLRAAIRGAVAFVGVTALVWLPYVIPPNFEILAFVHNASQINTFVGIIGSRDAANLWYVLGLGTQNAGVPFYGPLSLNLTGELLFGLIMLIVLVAIWLDAREDLLWGGAALIAFGFFTVMTLQFERYLYPALGLFFLAALFNRRYWLIYAITSITYVLNYEMSLFMYNAVTLSPGRQQELLLHLDRWQLGLINCAALLLSIGFFAWSLLQRAESSKQVFQPGFGLPQHDEQLAMASAFATAGAPDSAALTRPVVQSRGGVASTAMAAVMTDTLPATQRVRAVTPAQASAQAQTSTTPKLRLRPRTLGRPPYVSVVIPCYNEQGNIWPMYERLTAALSRITPTYEIIFVNNGSYDGSPELFEELAARDAKVSVLTLSRNFGSQGAYTAGFAYASGDCVVGLDGDIQDPPELIPALVEQWLQGYDVVYGVRARRKGSLPRRIGYKLFYRLLHKVSYVDIPHDASDFGLMDRRVVNVLNEMPERSRLIRGLRAFAGFSQTGIPYTRDERHAGLTTNSFFGLFRWASLGIISFSFAPLDLISYLAGGVVALAGVGMLVYTALYFIFPGAPHGYQTLLLVVLFLGAVQLLCLSIIGAYLGKIFEEVKARPRFLVNDIQNDHRAGGGA